MTQSTNVSSTHSQWPKTDSPMRIAILGWAQLSLQVREGSGYNLSASELASGLAMSGHTVCALTSGMRFSPIPGIRIKHLETWRDVACYDLVNSPCCSPAATNFHNMDREITSPKLTQSVLGWLDQMRVQVVHIHSLEGYSLDLIGAIRDTGRPVVCTLHNYWFVCPQVDLLHNETHVCDDYEGGNRCENCLHSAPTYTKQRLKRTIGRSLDGVIGPRSANIVRGTSYHIASKMSRTLRKGHTPRPTATGNDQLMPDPEVALGFDTISSRTHDSPHEGTIEHSLSLNDNEFTPLLGRAPIDQNERMLAGDATNKHDKNDRHLVVLNTYGSRRRAGVDALNRASLVTPPSKFVTDVHIRMGVNADRTRVVRLGQPHFDQINRRTRRHRLYTTRPWDAHNPDRPLRFGYFGTTRNNKGLDVLVRAIPLLWPEIRKKCQFLVRASGWDWPFRKRLSLFPEVQFAGGYDMLQLHGAWGEYDVGILPHVWFENSPLVLLEHLHAGKLVISSRLGGPVEWVKEPTVTEPTATEPTATEPTITERATHQPGITPNDDYNGLMFAGGDPDALARCITQLVTGEVAVPSPKEIHDATPILQSYPEHVREVEGIYRQLLADPTPQHAPTDLPEVTITTQAAALQPN